MIIWIPFIVLCLANTDSRSFMNAAFRTKSDAVDAEFIKQAEKHGIIRIKGRLCLQRNISLKYF